MTRNKIPINTARQLWAQCGGFCQNPSCNRPLFAHSGDEVVSLVNVAHIIGHGVNGPRSDHELAEIVEKDGIGNLIMLCLSCHKVVDELETQYSVADMQRWKAQHFGKITSLFSITRITDEQKLLREVNDLLDVNATVFRECGPFSAAVINGASGDGLTVWRRRCLDTILPNNQRIILLIERNKSSFPYPWDMYKKMLLYKMHADAFQDNCLLDRKVNDYKLFPLEFDHFVKTKLNIQVPPLQQVSEEELEYRGGQIRTFIDRFLSGHEFIDRLQELNKSTMIVDLRDGRSLKVFVTNTYCFTDYTFDRVMAVDPAVDAIICSCPAGTYSNSAKALCIEHGIGLFMLGEFMGAIRKHSDDYLNYLIKADRESRIMSINRIIKNLQPQTGISVYVFGSYLRKKIYADIDLMLVYANPAAKAGLASLEAALVEELERQGERADITIASLAELSTLRFQHNNVTAAYPQMV
jgi:predicted nucleotidyltransferase